MTTGYTTTEAALEASSSARVVELDDGSYGGLADDTIGDDGRVRSWAYVPSGLVQIARTDGPAFTWHVVD